MKNGELVLKSGNGELWGKRSKGSDLFGGMVKPLNKPSRNLRLSFKAPKLFLKQIDMSLAT